MSQSEIQLILPLIKQNRSIGYLLIQQNTLINIDNIDLLLAICDNISAVLENARYYQNLIDNNKQVDILNKFAIQLNETTDERVMYPIIESTFSDLFSHPIHLIYKTNSKSNYSLKHSHQHYKQSILATPSFNVDHSFDDNVPFMSLNDFQAMFEDSKRPFRNNIKMVVSFTAI